MATVTQNRTRHGRRVVLDNHLPVDHRLHRVYRGGAALMGAFLVVFGILGLIGRIGFFSTSGSMVMGLGSNGALSLVSVLVGGLLLAGAVIGGNTASTVNIVVALAFLAVGFASLAVLDTRFNLFAFHLQNVFFSFVTGLLLMTFGMYGRVSGSLPHDNPYWRSRHPHPHERPAESSAKPLKS
ncbi:DUF4383 domain-containing protein [Streptomyces sp. NPDC051546]|uniref:DUF4383 domain-containing protein n=1 Tax=Streptomyces sp. NPDC051546 TaxID=3365655 RepID=UPI0037BAD597